MSTADKWEALREKVAAERADFEQAHGRSKDARMVFAALAGAYGGVLRMMDALDDETEAT